MITAIQETRRQGHRTHVIIVGGGASGVLLACHLLRDPANAFDVTLVEKRPEVGRGIAYFTANPQHLLNVRAANMSAFSDQPDHFWRWLCAREHSGSVAWQNCGDPFCFVPRTIYGDYIAGLIAPLISNFTRPGRLRIIKGECVSIAQFRAGIVTTLADGSRHQGDAAVLAIGHEVPASYAGRYVDPWAMPADAGVDPNARILILGTGLTMIDCVLSLILSAHKGPVFAMSRRGLLPRAHRRAQPFPIDPAQVPFGKGMPELVRWLRDLIAKRAAHGDDWRSVIDGIRPFTQQIWRQLPRPARRSFLEHARAWWDVHRHRMAPEVESRVAAAIESGQLTVMAAKLCGIEEGAEHAVVRYRRRSSSTVETLQVDRIVECRQISSAPLKPANPLLRNLLDCGLARFDPLCIGIDVTPECAIVNTSGVPSERLFAVGPLTRAAFWEIVAVPEIRNQCAELASRLSQALAKPRAIAVSTAPRTKSAHLADASSP
jgi:uncharacterized NAD(P)/FAD-binding protein YdhS